MRLSLMGALALALIANLIPGGNRALNPGNAARGGATGETPGDAASGEAKEGATEAAPPG
ncbi:MAG: hypothetical protein ACT4P4_00215 [Betaproteobacteria bacterium]